MPTYEYECTSCKHKFEASQKMSDKPLSKCPKCNKKVKRLLGSGGGIIFSRKYSQETKSGSRCYHWENVVSGKGSGFYATDYRKQPKKSDIDKAPITCPKAKEGCSGCQSEK
ncbi:MAG: zinc ribbon domain-containing protein [Candidatus Omnitrophica bacterium]|nr:zinc ribbon domain-containing protein [Candidatus Omnitrophota bacterium]